MTRFRSLRFWFLMTAPLLWCACAAVPGGAGGNMGPAAMPGSLSGASATTNAGGDVSGGAVTGSAGSDAKAADNGSSVPNDQGGAGPTPYNVAMGAVPTTEIGVIADRPLPGGFPAPTHETPHTWPGVDGHTSVCRSGDKVLMTIEGFVGRAAFPGAPFVAYPNDYTFSVTNRVSHETVVSAPLESQTVHDAGGDVVRTGYINVVVPFARERYPDDLSDVEFLLLSNPKRTANLSEAESPLRGEKPIPILPPNILNLAGNHSDIPDCPVIKAVRSDLEGMEKALVSP